MSQPQTKAAQSAKGRPMLHGAPDLAGVPSIPDQEGCIRTQAAAGAVQRNAGFCN